MTKIVELLAGGAACLCVVFAVMIPITIAGAARRRRYYR